MALPVAVGVTPQNAASFGWVLGRIDALAQLNNPYTDDRWRIRQIMNGGADGIRAIMAWDKGKGSSGRVPDFGHDLPAVNLMESGVERLAQSIGQAPTLRMPYGPKDSHTAREAAELRERMVESWDHASRMPILYPQVGRWLPGYGFATWVIGPRHNPVTKQTWPHTELRDPFDTYPGFFGPGQNPVEIAYRRRVPIEVLEKVYPSHDWKTIAATVKLRGARGVGGALVGPGADGQRWEGNTSGGVEVYEYRCPEGNYVCVPEYDMVLEYVPNPCDTGPLFCAAKRVAFDKLVSQYHHIVGLVAMMAKFNVLSLIATERSALSEINIFGEMEGNTYKRGLDGFNFFEANARVERPRGDNNYQLFGHIDRLERQLRIGAAYDAGSDALVQRSGYITGAGQRELRDPINANVKEYQDIIALAMEDLDTRRLEYEEKTERAKRKRVFWIEGDRHASETYIPSKDIAGNWHSRRVYGMMATWDESAKIVGGLQLLQSGVIDRTTLRENLAGIDSTPQVESRSTAERARSGLMSALEQQAGQGNPTALMALVEIGEKPDRVDTILKKFFTPQEPQMSPEEAAMAAAGGVPGAPPGMAPSGGEIGPPPTVQTMLAQMETGGRIGGGVQTVTSQRRPG